MGEVLNVVVAVAVIVFIVRWVSSGMSCRQLASGPHSTLVRGRSAGKDEGSANSPSAILGFRPRNVTIEEVRLHALSAEHRAESCAQVETIHSMFPDIPR